MKLYQFAAVTAATLVLTACGGDKAPETEAAETNHWLHYIRGWPPQLF